ncbi:MAG: cytochrome c biogenesis protein CcdA [Candidatus Spechtbacterales bacterium]|nr:cytochrome c biogenesis protein CcdA [Candidatus Spechtbacterales bacterium]
MGNELSITVAFLAGIVSFLSPCVLPLIPGFLAYLAGTATKDAGKGEDGQNGQKINKRRATFMSSVFFVLGFSTVFASIGVLLNSLLEGIAYDVQLWLSRIGGVLIIFFGLYLTRLIKIPFLEREYKPSVKKKFKSHYLTSFVFGAAFAAGWTPCVGAVLGGILSLAASAPGSAFSLLIAYSLGLGLPFLVVGLFTSRAEKLINKHAKALNYVNIAFGYVLIVLGVLVFTQKLSVVANLEIVNSILLK